MLKNQIISGFFLTSDDYYSGQVLKKGISDVRGDVNQFFTHVVQKTKEKTGKNVVHIRVCKKQIYSIKKRENIFSLKAKSGAEVISVTPATEWQKDTAVLQAQVVMV